MVSFDSAILVLLLGARADQFTVRATSAEASSLRHKG